MVRVTISIVSLLAAQVLGLSTDSMSIVHNTRYLVLWGSDTVYSAKLSDSILSDIRPIIENSVKNIIDTRVAGDGISIVGKDPLNETFDKFTLFVWQPGSIPPRKILEREGLLRAWLSPDKEQAVLLVCGSHQCDLLVTELRSGKDVVLVKGMISRSAEVTWHPMGSHLAFQSGGDIRVVDIRSSASITLVKGEAPSWSPNGNFMAYRSGKDLLIYDYERKISTEIYHRYFWQTEFYGRISWTPDSQSLSFTVFAGLTGYDNECILIDVNSQKTTSLYTGPYFCGDWLDDNLIGQRK